MKAFIDCGGHIGLAVAKFRRTNTGFTVYSFEPCPHLSRHYRDRKDIVFSDSAVWIRDGEIDMYVDTSAPDAYGSSLFREKITGRLDRDHPIRVKCFDFSRWVGEHFTLADYVVLKMDIEGAEYAVLDKMLTDGTIDLIDVLYAEFHYMKIGVDALKHDELVARLRKRVDLRPEYDVT